MAPWVVSPELAWILAFQAGLRAEAEAAAMRSPLRRAWDWLLWALRV